MLKHLSHAKRRLQVAALAGLLTLGASPVFAQVTLPDPGVDVEGITEAGVTKMGTYLAAIIVAAFAMTLVYAAWRRLRRIA